MIELIALEIHLSIFGTVVQLLDVHCIRQLSVLNNIYRNMYIHSYVVAALVLFGKRRDNYYVSVPTYIVLVLSIVEKYILNDEVFQMQLTNWS